MIHIKDRAVVTAAGKTFPYDGSPQDRRRAIQEAQADIALRGDALIKRSLAERGRPPSDKEMRDGRYEPPEKRGSAEIDCQRLLDQGAQYNVWQARADALRASRTNSSELGRLDELAASWVPPPAVVAVPVSAYDTAIASLLAKPGHTSEERAVTDRAIARLREAV